MIEVCHGIEAVPQPRPVRNEGGDCFACALTAALRWLYPEHEISFDDVFPLFKAEYADPAAQGKLEKLRDAVRSYLEGRAGCGTVNLRETLDEIEAAAPRTTVCNVWGRGGMGKAIGRASLEWSDDWAALHVEYDLLQPEYDVEIWSHGWWHQQPTGRWARRLELWLRAGYVAFAEQRYAGDGPYTSEGYFHSTDHFVLIDGVRMGWERNGDGESRSWREYVHVVCSVRGGYWIEVGELLRKHGTAGLMLVRREER